MGKPSLTTEIFIEKAIKIHYSKYDYSLVNYINSYNKVKIICPLHGIFEQVARDHFTHGCNKCAIELRAKSIALDTQEFINKAQEIHKNKYDYCQVNYKNNDLPVNIICEKHGIFSQRASDHLAGSNCPSCAKAGISQLEINWLDLLNIPNKYRQISIKIDNKKFKVDGYDPSTNTIYEFYGDFWHGNPKVYHPENLNNANHKTFGRLYQETLEREAIIKSANYNLITKWETDIA